MDVPRPSQLRQALRRLVVVQRDDYAEQARELRRKLEHLTAEFAGLRAEMARLKARFEARSRSIAELPKSSGLNRPQGPTTGANLFFVSLPKSGTIFTWQSLQDTTGLKIPNFSQLEGWPDYTSGRDFSCPDLYSCGDFNTQLLRPENMQYFLNGFVFGSHMQASYHNMRVLKEAGINRITVLLRDPRDALVSWVHHLRSLGPSSRNYHSKMYHIPRDYYCWPLEQQFAYQVRSFLPIAVNWIEGWLDYYASLDREIDVLFVYYDELKRQPARYIQRIAEFHDLGQVDVSRIPTVEPGKLHFRKGEHDQWLQELSEKDRRLVDDIMGDRLLQGFHVAATSQIGFVKAKQELSVGHPERAASAALDAIIEFPNYRPAYMLLLDAASACGVETEPLRDLLEVQVGNSTVARQFIYDYPLVDACASLVDALAGSPKIGPAAGRPNSKVILPYEPGYTGHWEMKKRRKETRDWLRKREQQVNRMNTPSIVPEFEPDAVTEPGKNDHH
jgi:sulfotransferase family protein